MTFNLKALHSTKLRRAAGNFRGQGSGPQRGYNTNVIQGGNSLELYSSDLETEETLQEICPHFATFSSFMHSSHPEVIINH